MNLYGRINSQDDSEKENHRKKTCFIIYKIYISYIHICILYIRYIYIIYICFKVIVIYLFFCMKDHKISH